MNTNTKLDSVLEAFENGAELTAKQIKTRFNVANPHDAVHQLRGKGYAIYLNARKNSKGETVNRYRLGKPTRRIVAAGIAALGLEGSGLV
jgi:predicted transcriptional regulator